MYWLHCVTMSEVHNVTQYVLHSITKCLRCVTDCLQHSLTVCLLHNAKGCQLHCMIVGLLLSVVGCIRHRIFQPRAALEAPKITAPVYLETARGLVSAGRTAGNHPAYVVQWPVSDLRL